MQVTISNLLGIQQQVKSRLNELVQLRTANSSVKDTRWGANADKPVYTYPTYDAVKLEHTIGKLYREQRRIDEALKNANATILVPNYDWDDSVLGELEQADAVIPVPKS